MRHVAPAYGIPVIVHSKYCTREHLPWFDGMLEADEVFYQEHGETLFTSHMLDLSDGPLDENIEICKMYFERMAKMDLIMEISFRRGVEVEPEKGFRLFYLEDSHLSLDDLWLFRKSAEQPPSELEIERRS